MTTSNRTSDQRAAFEAYYRERFPDADFSAPLWDIEWQSWQKNGGPPLTSKESAFEEINAVHRALAIKNGMAPPTSNPPDELGRLRWLAELMRTNPNAYVHDVLEVFDRYWPTATADETTAQRPRLDEATEWLNIFYRDYVSGRQVPDASWQHFKTWYEREVAAADKSEPPPHE